MHTEITEWYISVRAGFLYSFQSSRNILITVTTSLAIGLLFIFLIFPRFTLQMLARDVSYVGFVVQSLVELEFATHGWVGIVSIIIYSLFAGVLTTTTLGQLDVTTEGSSFFGILPGLMFAGCASCGAGVFGLLGVFGLSAVLPFGGLGLRFLAIILLLGLIVRNGDPEVCSVNIDG